MKKIKVYIIFIAIICLMVNNYSFGQADPSVNGASFSPKVIANVNGNTATFTFVNNAHVDENKGDDVQMIITFSHVKPESNFSPSTDISGAGAAYFDWVFDQPNNTITGTLNSIVPAGSGGQINIGKLTSTQSSPAPTASNGFTAFVSTYQAYDNNLNNNTATGVASTTYQPLPVTLIGFTGNENLCKANLKWATADEINFNHFDVQQSLDGVNFTTIGSVNSNHKANGSNYQISYEMPGGIVFYRLKIVDNNGSFNYSEIIHFKSSCPNSSLIKVYPNPAVNNVTVTGLSLNTQVNILSINGQLLSKAIATNTSLIMDVSRYAKGSYLLEVIDNGKSVNKTTIIK